MRFLDLFSGLKGGVGMLQFVCGLIVGGVIGMAVMAILQVSKNGEITETELVAWEQHLKEVGKRAKMDERGN